MPGHGDISGLAQGCIEPGEQGIDRLRLGQPLAECPDRLRVRHFVLQAQAQEAHETQPVADQEFSTVIREIVLGLDDQHFEHENRIERRATPFLTIRIGQCLVQVSAEYFEIHRRRIGLKLVAEITQALEPFIDVEITSLSSHPDTPLRDQANESRNRLISEVNRGPQLQRSLPR